ncbi:glycosyltransferase family 39 protein [Phragmitibacter flavus]|uniref:Glycosyltransferase family 39 protein n=1 Tax=Phragmitibacter flavus TaxID=2576071 RepID=A0A5R8KJ22_9BACT|nr:glycosyltransferase family 39 protein [Phragmitibacter flavus]TLD71619.1 glycosyltransferase family 39 protein [Phragmitibacter flavus]
MNKTAWLWLVKSKGWLLAGFLLIGLGLFVVTTAGEWPGAMASVAAEGKRPKVIAYVHTYAWWAAVIDMVLIVLLALTSRWWTRGSQSLGSLPVVERIGLKRWLVVLALLVFAVWLRWPRMELSFYNDEAFNFMRMVCGDWRERDADVVMRFREVKWVETWWLNNIGNNSQPHSVLSRLSYDAWRGITGSAQGEVKELAVRLPAFLAGLSGLVLLGFAVRSMAGNGAAFWAMLAGAVHGWHLRYSTEARGYSLMLLGVCLGWWFLHRAVHSGRWRDWAGYGLGMFLTIWSFPGSIYFLAVQNGLLMAWLGWRWQKGELELPLLLRPVVTGIVAVMVALPLMLPLMPQLLLTLREGAGIQGEMRSTWQTDMFGYLLAGCRGLDWQVWNPRNISVCRWFLEMPWTIAVLAVVTVGTTVFGSVRLLRQGGVAALLVVSGPLAVEVAWFAMVAKGQVLHHWYGLYALPGVLAALGVGIAGFRRVQVPFGALALVLPLLLAWQWRDTPKQDERGPVLAVRGAVYPHYASHEALFGAFWCNSVIYDPRMLALATDADFDALVARARAEKRDLYVNFSHRDLAKQTMPEAVARLEKGQEFEAGGVFWGQEEPQFTQYLFKLRPTND